MLSKSKIFLAAIGLVLLLLVTQVDRLAKIALTAYVEHRLGVSLEIRGALQLSLGTNTTVSVKDVSLALPAATLSANVIEVSILSRSVWAETLEITNLLIERANLQVLADTAPSTPLDLERSIEKLDQLLLSIEQFPIQIDRAKLYQSQLAYQDADQNIDLAIATATLLRANDRGLELTVDGTLNQASLTLDARIKRPANVRLVNLDGRWGEYGIKLDGHVEQLSPLGNIDLVFNADGPSAARLLELLGAKEVRDGPLSLTTQLRDEDHKLVWFSQASVGELVVNSQLTHSLLGSDFKLEFQTSGPSLREAGALIDYLGYSELPFTASGALSREGNQVTLEESRITLGEGHFEATGLLPNYPSWDSWQVDISAKAFNLTILQPFSPCQIPNLAMDWTGNFSSKNNGNEVFNLSLANSGRSISLTGELGSYPGLVGSSIKINSEGLDLNSLSGCIGLPLLGDYPFATSLELTRTDVAWEIHNWKLESDLITTRSKGAISIEGSLTSSVEVHIPDLDNFATALGADSYLKAAAADFEFHLAGQGRRLAVSNGKVSTESSKGSFTGHFDSSSAPEDIGLTINLTGTDIQKLMRDSPKLVDGLPFNLTTELSNGSDGKIKADASMALAGNQIRFQTTIPRTESLKDLMISIDGQGENLEHMFGSFVPYPLPSEPFDIAFNLVHRGDAVRVDSLLMKTGGQSLTADFTLDLVPNMSQTRGQLSLTGDSSRTLFNLIGLKNDFLDEPYQVQLSIDGDQDRMNIHIDKATMGASDVTGQIAVIPGDVNELNFDLRSKRIYLPTFFPTIITATSEQKDPSAKKDKVLPQIEFSWQSLSGIKVDFSHSAERIDLQPGNFSSAQLSFTIEDGRLLSQDINWQSKDSDGTAVLVVIQDPVDHTSASIEFEITSERIPMLWLFTGSPITSDGEHLQFNAKLNSKGKTTLELSKNLNGLIIFRGGGGSINSKKLDTFFGDFLFQLTKRVFSTADSQTNVICTGGAFSVQNGKVNFDPGLAIRTSRFDILTSGEINLPTEALKLQLNSRSRQGIGVSAVSSLIPRVGVGGTMAKPHIQVSATETALSGGAAIASSGLSILASGLWDRLRSGLENPCDAVYSRAIKNPKAGFGVLANGTSNSTSNNTSNGTSNISTNGHK